MADNFGGGGGGGGHGGRGGCLSPIRQLVDADPPCISRGSLFGVPFAVLSFSALAHGADPEPVMVSSCAQTSGAHGVSQG